MLNVFLNLGLQIHLFNMKFKKKKRNIFELLNLQFYKIQFYTIVQRKGLLTQRYTFPPRESTEISGTQNL